MVLCQHFLQGNCRFGSKCSNDHIDIKQHIKTDVESAINGHQWPLSCFGPFKDKPSLPNFIEDQSFEEVRYLCYASKQKNFFEQFHQQFQKEVLESTNKTKALLQFSPDVLNVIIKIYDTQIGTNSVTNTATTKTNSSNPFGVGGAASNSLFGNSTGNSTNIFGGTSNTANSGAGIFGGATNTNTKANSIFGGGTNAFGAVTAQQSSIFDQQQQKPTASVFGGAINTSNQQTSIFGQQQQSTGTNLFAQAAQQTNPVVGGNLFAQPVATNNAAFGLFSQPAATSVFGQPQNNLFAQAAAVVPAPNTTQPVAGGNIFGQAAVQAQNVFGQPQLQAQQPQVAATNNIFGQAVQQMSAQTQQNPPSGFFSQALQQSQPEQQQQDVGIFVQLKPVVAPNAMSLATAGNMQQQPQQQPQVVSTVADNSVVYSKMDKLTPAELEAFQADLFTLGNLPCNPPPRELCF